MRVTFDHREDLCDWLKAHGIDPKEVPEDADLTTECDGSGQRWIRCEIYSTNTRGQRFMNVDGSDAARTRIMVPLQSEPPPWWQPHTRPSREQLLEALGAVRHIHQPAEHRGQTICAHCSALDDQGTTDNSPAAYPCDTIKALHALPSVRIPLDPPETREEPCSS